jgi:hypothetical protein
MIAMTVRLGVLATSSALSVTSWGRLTFRVNMASYLTFDQTRELIEAAIGSDLIFARRQLLLRDIRRSFAAALPMDPSSGAMCVSHPAPSSATRAVSGANSS